MMIPVPHKPITGNNPIIVRMQAQRKFINGGRDFLQESLLPLVLKGGMCYF